MQIENDYDKEVYNGDIGYVVDVDADAGELVASFDGHSVTYGFGELDTLVPAYAATIHKSQGSEYPAVIIPVLTQHYVMLQRNLLYTGADLILVGVASLGVFLVLFAFESLKMGANFIGRKEAPHFEDKSRKLPREGRMITSDAGEIHQFLTDRIVERRLEPKADRRRASRRTPCRFARSARSGPSVALGRDGTESVDRPQSGADSHRGLRRHRRLVQTVAASRRPLSLFNDVELGLVTKPSTSDTMDHKGAIN
jgi:hypothetical protein